MDIRLEIFDFLASKTGSNAPTTPLDLLDFRTVLAEKVSRLSVTVNAATGAVTLLYSGRVSGDLASFSLAEDMGNRSVGVDGKVGIITIGQTEAGKFLGDKDLLTALQKSVGSADAALILDGATETGQRVNNNSLFDQISRRLVFAAPGDFISLV